ncbi:MAG: tetratricopeptide repeat protein [Planctomycetes bacterium]|nr:tetratricopeptide repeat protein [Planctomycetota bacterium]
MPRPLDRALLYLIILAIACAAAPPSFARVPSIAMQSQPSEPDPDLEEGRDRMLSGDYEAAEKKFTRVLKEKADDRVALAMRARAKMLQFNISDACADARELLKIDPKNPIALLILADAAARDGKYEDAIEQAKLGFDGALDFTCRMRIVQYNDEIGNFDAARDGAKKVAARVEEPRAESSAPEMLSLGLALERIGEYESASQCYVSVEKTRGGEWLDPLVKQDALVALGNLYQRVYRNVAGRGNGEKEYNLVLKQNLYHYGANVARYKLGRANFQMDDSRAAFHMAECFDRVISMDPNSAELAILHAQALIPDRRFEDARRALEKVIAKNPRILVAKLELTALDYLQSRKAAFDAARDDDAKTRPNVSILPTTIGTYLKNLYRFADGIPFLEEAVRRNPKDAEAYTALGECYAHTAREKEALVALNKAEEIEAGFVHPWRSNMLEVLEVIDKKYLTLKSPNFIFKMHPEDEPVLKETLPDFFEATRKDYAQRYGYQPPFPVQVEVFRRFDDFSVRSVGFAGFGALGVCFGPLITAVSPEAEEFRGHFSYLDALWHEYAHVVHIALSKARVPRWFTEGLATLEEKKRNPAFDRHMEIELLESRATGNIYPIMELNSAFHGPRIIFGYYQGGLICEYLEKKSSTDRLAEALKLFAEDAPLDSVIKNAFGMSVEELDRGFLQFVDEKLKNVKVRPVLDDKTIRRMKLAVSKNPKDAETLRSLAWAYAKRGMIADSEVYLSKLRAVNDNDPDGYLIRGELALLRKRPDTAIEFYEKGFAKGAEEFYARMKYAEVLAKMKPPRYEEVKLQFRAAINAFPEYAEENQNPRLLLARLLDGEEQHEESTKLMEELCKINGTATTTRLELAKRYEGKGDIANQARMLGEILDVDPFQRSIQKELALALIQIGKFDPAARAARNASNIDPAREPRKPPPPGANPSAPQQPKDPDPADEARERADCIAIEGEAQLFNKKNDEAAACAKRALKLDPDCDRAKELQQKLGAGR